MLTRVMATFAIVAATGSGLGLSTTLADDTPLKALDSSPPDSTARVFAPGIVSTSLDDWAIACAPQGHEIYFTVRGRGQPAIVSMAFSQGRWSDPEVAAFSGRYYDSAPTISRDGERLVFVSRRPLEAGEESEDANLWITKRDGDHWGTPTVLSTAVNTEGVNEGWPYLASNGDLYFSATREEGHGGEDIYLARWQEDRYLPAENLGPPVNTELGEYCPFVGPDGSYLIVEVIDRPDGFGGGDMYISRRQADGSWGALENLGEAFNTSRHDCLPRLSPGGEFVFFLSNRRVRVPESAGRTTYRQIRDTANQSGGFDIYWIGAEALRLFLLGTSASE